MSFSMKQRKPQSEAPAAAAVRARLRAAIARGEVTIDRVAKLSDGLSWTTVSNFAEAKTEAQDRVVVGVSAALDAVLGSQPRAAFIAPHIEARASPPPIAGRTFDTDDARIAYALGVLDMAGTSNVIAMQHSAEVSRSISTAAAALIAPLGTVEPVVVPKATPIDPAKMARARAAADGSTEADLATPAPRRRRKA
jgi:hypothetical protein